MHLRRVATAGSAAAKQVRIFACQRHRGPHAAGAAAGRSIPVKIATLVLRRRCPANELDTLEADKARLPGTRQDH